MKYTRHTNNWALVVDTSRFWFNYRHIANALSLYHSVKRLGIPDSQIVLMLADGMPCNARNCYPGQIYNSHDRKINLYGTDVEVDYRGNEVSVANFIKVLTGRHDEDTPASRRLDTDEHSNVFVFMTGHGGDEFLKFHDYEEIASQDIADAISEMHAKKRYNELFFMVDTCQAGTLSNSIRSPNVVTIGSSKQNENSYAHNANTDIGVSLIDRFTKATLDFMESVTINSEQRTLHDLFQFYNPKSLYSTPVTRTDMLSRKVQNVPLTDFLGSVLHIKVSNAPFLLTPASNTTEQSPWQIPSVPLMQTSAQENQLAPFSYSPAFFLQLALLLSFVILIK